MRRTCRGAQVPFSWAHRHCAPVRLSRAGCSRQFGRASAPTMPQRVHTIRGPNVGTGTSSGHGSALMIARWWHCQQDTSSERADAVRPHVAEGHGLDRIVGPRGGHVRKRRQEVACGFRSTPTAEGRQTRQHLAAATDGRNHSAGTSNEFEPAEDFGMFPRRLECRSKTSCPSAGTSRPRRPFAHPSVIEGILHGNPPLTAGSFPTTIFSRSWPVSIVPPPAPAAFAEGRGKWFGRRATARSQPLFFSSKTCYDYKSIAAL
jgi:hypothetical protein